MRRPLIWKIFCGLVDCSRQCTHSQTATADRPATGHGQTHAEAGSGCRTGTAGATARRSAPTGLSLCDSRREPACRSTRTERSSGTAATTCSIFFRMSGVTTGGMFRVPICVTGDITLPNWSAACSAATASSTKTGSHDVLPPGRSGQRDGRCPG